MKTRLTSDQLSTIVEQAMSTQCACPSLLSRLVWDMQYLHDYQQQCLRRDNVDIEVHAAIADSVETAYPILEECLMKILRLEKWNLETLEMPTGLRDQIVRDIELSCPALPAMSSSYRALDARG